MSKIKRGIIKSIYTQNKMLMIDAEEDTAMGKKKIIRGLTPDETLTKFSLPELIGKKITIRQGKAILDLKKEEI